ncbi:hypothetical protein KC343_g3221 [Hortaea werneckii]|nr:hypothetical protein KC352_g11566 [Hortaea werneckii]KAI7569456.1 hypothetical protein KC317_g3320 [Hortaea werneckii]KAI7612146.1 hypothetical protein KC346_g7966 [Hortaea werneckii]KAI7632899.1 hypothetical protein KC343_g3221 [Hortaea werneckii]KAI7663606.1 hypothetical protein KC319_g7707 [Hortaea werneckii]
MAATQANKAAIIPSKGANFSVSETSIPEITPTEVLIRVHAVAINPADAIIQHTGMIIDDYPAPGDRVLAACAPSVFDPQGPKRDNWGTFQTFVAAKATVTVKIPDQVEYREACVLPLGCSTAAIGLFSATKLGLALPQLEPLAKAAGYEVAATCSKQNTEFCKGAGADYVFDHRNEDVVEEILAALKGKAVVGVFGCIMPADALTKCGKLASELGGAKKFVTVFAGEDQAKQMAGDTIAAIPQDVVISHCDEWLNTNESVRFALIDDWLGPALDKGLMKCLPRPEVVGKGLEHCQEACNRMLRGVSATKLVVEVP